MQRTVSLKVVDAPHDECEATVEAFRDACQLISALIEDGHRVNFIALQKSTYRDLPSLPSQMRISACRVVVGTWRSWRANGQPGRPPTFRRPVAPYQHDRDWSLRPDGVVSFRLLGRRVKLCYRTSPLGHARLAEARESGELGGARLVRKRKGWFLEVSVTLLAPTPYEPTTFVGVDAGINVLAVSRAPGHAPLVVRGGSIAARRHHDRDLRQRLQRKGTLAPRRLVKRHKSREQRFVRNECWVVARDIVAYAKAHHAAIALEDLQGIRGRARAHGATQRFRLHAWPFCVLHQAIRDRAEAEGLPIRIVESAYTSQACPRCGYTARTNRRAAWFLCRACGYGNHADVVGATNIAMRAGTGMLGAGRAAVNRPDERGHEDEACLHESEPTFKPQPSVCGC